MAGRFMIPGSSVGRRAKDVRLVGGLVLLCVSGVALVGCQKGASTEPAGLDAESPLARITVEKSVVDLREVGTDSKVSGKFTFTSSGKGKLRIVRTQSCGGVLTRGVKDGRTYRPGERGTLEFNWVTDSSPQAMEKLIRMQTNDPNQKFVSLTIKDGKTLSIPFRGFYVVESIRN